MLNEVESLWGYNIFDLKATCKRYKFYSFILMMSNVLIVFILAAIMFYTHADVVSYIGAMIIWSIFGYLIYNRILNPLKYAIYKFYNKHSNDTIIEKSYNIDKEKMYSILYCLASKRLKQYKTMEGYMELILNSCANDYTFANAIIKVLNKYESKDGELTIKVLVDKKNREFLINFVDEESKDEEEIKEIEMLDKEDEEIAEVKDTIESKDGSKDIVK